MLASEEDKNRIEKVESRLEEVEGDPVIFQGTAPGGPGKAEEEQEMTGVPVRSGPDTLQPGDESERSSDEITESQDITKDLHPAGRPGWRLSLVAVITGAGLIWFLIARWRRSKKRQKPAE